jgi:peptide/nickel transport system ATP-binding protein
MTTTPHTATEDRDTRPSAPLVEVKNLTMDYVVKGGRVSAVSDVSFTVRRGGSLGLVGESGCGKTSAALTLLRLQADNAEITRGEVLLNGLNLLALSEEEMRRHRWKDVAMVFQGAMNAWNPVYRVGDQIREALDLHWPVKLNRQQVRDRITELFALVGLPPEDMDRYPHEFSGGMRQRATIAMALSCNPQLIIADEPTTALDVIVQDQILKELKTIQAELGMSIIYISHDIAVIAQVTEDTGVMYAGKLVEYGDTGRIFATPRHPYAWLLLSSTPSITGPRRKLAPLVGEPPDLTHPPSGCRFHPRCPFATDKCSSVEPQMEDLGDGHQVACWNHERVPVGLSETAAEEI